MKSFLVYSVKIEADLRARDTESQISDNLTTEEAFLKTTDREKYTFLNFSHTYRKNCFVCYFNCFSKRKKYCGNERKFFQLLIIVKLLRKHGAYHLPTV